MKAAARRIIERFLRKAERDFPTEESDIPELSSDQWRWINAILNAYRTSLDEKMVEAEMRRPQISLGELDSRTLRELCRPQTVIDVEATKEKEAG